MSMLFVKIRNNTLMKEIIEIYKIFGLDASRDILFNKLNKVLKNSCIPQNHISLLVDMLIFEVANTKSYQVKSIKLFEEDVFDYKFKKSNVLDDIEETNLIDQN